MKIEKNTPAKYILGMKANVFFPGNNTRTGMIKNNSKRGGVVQWVACLTRNVEVVCSSPIQGPRCFIEQDALPLLLTKGFCLGTDSSVISQSN